MGSQSYTFPRDTANRQGVSQWLASTGKPVGADDISSCRYAHLRDAHTWIVLSHWHGCFPDVRELLIPACVDTQTFKTLAPEKHCLSGRSAYLTYESG